MRILEKMVTGLLGLALLGTPFLLTAWNLLYLFLPNRPRVRKAGIVLELATIVLGSFITLAYCHNIRGDWDKVIYTTEKHTPLATWAMPTFFVFIGLAILAYFPLRFVPAEQLPPLLAVVCVAAIYAGAIECVAFAVQVGQRDWVLLLPPANCLLIAAHTVKDLLRQKRPRWPLWALLALLPFAGIVVAALFLAGQKPEYAVTVFTDTADWALSQKTPPGWLEFEGHYLCTVAAQGHAKLVKPLRLGRRHGRPVIVNRQLCVANAFEQLLEQRAPRLQQCLRYAYDHTGFHLSRHIHSKQAADVVYVLMKPLEWMFLTALYLCTAQPEERIKGQYR